MGDSSGGVGEAIENSGDNGGDNGAIQSILTADSLTLTI
jgi:hypothetical protein